VFVALLMALGEIEDVPRRRGRRHTEKRSAGASHLALRETI